MNRPWMPFYPSDYLAATTHLSTVEHGAYCLLIFHYWTKGSLPPDDDRLARIVRLPISEWDSIKKTMAEFFSEGWKHKRIEFELTEANRRSRAGIKAGLASAKSRKLKGFERPLNDRTNDLATTWQPLQSQPQKKALLDSSESNRFSKRGKRIPADWKLDEKLIGYASARGLKISEINFEVEKFKNFWQAKSGTGATKVDWDATWRSWVLNTTERRGLPAPNGGNGGAPGTSNANNPRKWDHKKWSATIDLFGKTKIWRLEWGPEIGEPGCMVPADLQNKGLF